VTVNSQSKDVLNTVENVGASATDSSSVPLLQKPISPDKALEVVQIVIDLNNSKGG
jgi:hypothetical protein